MKRVFKLILAVSAPVLVFAYVFTGELLPLVLAGVISAFSYCTAFNDLQDSEEGAGDYIILSLFLLLASGLMVTAIVVAFVSPRQSVIEFVARSLSGASGNLLPLLVYMTLILAPIYIGYRSLRGSRKKKKRRHVQENESFGRLQESYEDESFEDESEADSSLEQEL